MILLAGGNALLAISQDADLLRQDLELAQSAQALAIAGAVREPVMDGSWVAVRDLLNRIEQTLPGTRLWITDSTGAMLVDSQQAYRDDVLGPEDFGPSTTTDVKKVWVSRHGLLRAQAQVPSPGERVAAVLIIETDYTVKFTQLYASDLARTIWFLVGLFLILAAILLVNWKLFLEPLNQIYRIANAIKQGSGVKQHMPESNVLELKQVGTAFNEMIDHLAGQQDALQEMNRNLEATVAERTAALEASNIEIRTRANRLETLNGLVASTAGVMDMQALIETALEQMLRIFHPDVGLLKIEETEMRVGDGAEALSRSLETGPGRHLRGSGTLVIYNWEETGNEDALSPLAHVMMQNGLRSTVSVPVFVSGERSGEMSLATRLPRQWTADEVALVEIIANHLGTATERIRSVEYLQSHNDFMRKAMETGARLNRMQSLDQVIAAVGEGALRLSQADRLAIFTTDAGGEAVCAWASGISEKFIHGALAYAREWMEKMNRSESHNELQPFLYTVDGNQVGNFPPWEVDPAETFRAVSVWPLVYEQQSNALVCCYYNEPKQWKQSEQETLVMFFRQAAAVLVNTRLFEAERDQRILTEALRDVAATLNSTLELEEVLDGILSNLGRVVPHSSAIVMVLENDVIRPARWRGVPEAYSEKFKTWKYALSGLRNRQIMVETVQAIVIPNTLENANWMWTRGLEWVRSYAGAPICQRGEVTGFIDVMSTQPEFFDAKTGPILQAFANQAAIALENARLYYNTQQRMVEASTLYRAVQPLFNPPEDIGELARQITEAVITEFSSAHCSILLLDENQKELRLVAQSGALRLNDPNLPLEGPGLTVKAVKTGKAIYSPDVTKDPNYVYGAAVTRSELVIPLYAGGQVIGALNLESQEVDAFDERGQRLLASFAEQAALGLENARLFATIRQNARQMELLNEIAQRRAQEAETIRKATTALSATLDLETVLERILDQLEQVVPHDSAIMFLVEDDQRLRVWAGRNLSVDENVYFSRENLLVKEIEGTMQPVTLDDAQEDERYHAWGEVQKTRSWMGVPLIRGSELMGILALNRYELRVFRPEDVELAKAFANQAAIAVQNAQLYESTQQRARELEALHTATTSLVSTLDLQKLLERILESSISAIPAARAATLHLLDENDQLRLRVQHGLSESEAQSPEWNANNSLWNWVLKEQHPTLVSDTREIAKEIMGNGLPGTWKEGALLMTPLLQEDRPLGLITLFAPETGAFFDRDLHLLISFASTATAAIQNAQLHSVVQNLAITDPLTGLLNRRGFFNLARLAMEKATLLDRPLSFIMIDIDYFKNINDRYGHDAGDVVLQVLSRRCRQALREMDLVCRYGGEEFAILLPESDLAGAQAAANRLFKNITETTMETAAGAIWVTISVGVATVGEDCDTLDLLIKRADQALYLAKGFGRNQVQVWKR